VMDLHGTKVSIMDATWQSAMTRLHILSRRGYVRVPFSGNRIS
jgi:hypothetical protein